MSDSRPRSRPLFVDVVVEAAIGVTVRPLRTSFTVLGIAVGVAALVTTVGLAATTTRSVSERFDELRAREVVVSSRDGTPFPSDVDQKLSTMPGVTVGGVLGPATLRPLTVQTYAGSPAIEVSIVAATNGGLAAANSTITGRSLEGFRLDSPVAIVGSDVADRLGIRLRGTPTTILLDGVTFTVVGILEGAERRQALTSEVIVPAGIATTLWSDGTPPAVLIDVEPGAAQQVAAKVPLVLRPNNPEGVEPQLLPEARRLRTDITDELDSLGLAIASTILGVAGLTTAATMTLSVLERRKEIGLHRALGAKPFHIGIRFLLEASVVGLLGGVIGTSAGVIVLTTAASAQGSVPALPLWTVPAAVGVGLAIAILSGVYPSYRAARLDPIAALRE